MVFGYYHCHPKALTLTLSQRERVGVRARKTENYFGFSIIQTWITPIQHNSRGYSCSLSHNDSAFGIIHINLVLFFTNGIR